MALDREIFLMMLIMKLYDVTPRMVLKLSRNTARPHGYRALSCRENIPCS